MASPANYNGAFSAQELPPSWRQGCVSPDGVVQLLALVAKLKSSRDTPDLTRTMWGNAVTLQAVANQLKTNINVLRVASSLPSTKAPLL